MSRQIDLSDLSDDDRLYLAERERLPEGEDDPRKVVENGGTPTLPNNTGDVNTNDASSMIMVDAEEEVIFSDYEDMNVDDLKDELRRRDLPVSGNRGELIARLEADDGGDG